MEGIKGEREEMREGGREDRESGRKRGGMKGGREGGRERREYSSSLSPPPSEGSLSAQHVPL